MRFKIFAVLVLSSTTLWAETELEHVLVSVPLHKKTAETALPVTVISGDDLRRAAAATIGDTLAMTPGVANASFGPAVGQPVIRGQQGPRVSILQNGTASADASSLSADHAVSVEPVLADSLEILRGPATLLYGGGAIGGVINVLDNRIPTSPQEGISGALELRHESVSDMDTVVAKIEGGTGQFAWHVDGMYRDYSDVEVPGFAGLDPDEDDSRGSIENTSGRADSFTLGGSYHFDAGFIGLSVNRLRNAYGIPAGSHTHAEHGHEDEHEDEHGDEHEDEHGDEHGDEHEDGHEDEHEEEHEDGHGEEGIRLEVKQTRWDGILHWHEPLAGVEVLRVFATATQYEHQEIEGEGEVGTEFDNETLVTRFEAVHKPLAGLHGVIGFQTKSGDFSALGEEAFIPVTSNSELGIFVLEDFHYEDFTVELGLRYDRVERDPTSIAARTRRYSALSGSASVLWQVSDPWQIGLSLSSAGRAPTTEELFSNHGLSSSELWVPHAATRAIELGNNALDTEVSNNIDLALRWSVDANWVDLTVYQNEFSDYIHLVSTGEEVDELPVRQYEQEDARFRGIELDSEFSMGNFAGGEVSLGVFGDVIRGDLNRGGDVPRLPPDRLGARLGWHNDNLRFSAQVLSAARQDKPGLNDAPTSGFTRVDVDAEYRHVLGMGEVVWFASLKNILDEEIRASTSFLRDVAPEAGRSINAGVRLLF